MKNFVKLVIEAAMLSGLAVADIAPANAGVSVGIGIGAPGPGPHARYCYRHPHACGYRDGYRVGYGGPEIGVYVGGHGYWDGHRYWAHRDGFRGHWRFH